MSTRKFAFVASLLAVFGLLAGSAHAATKYTTMTDLKGGSDTSHSSETSWGNVFGNGGGISNGTLTVKFAKDKWGTFDGLSVIVGQKGVLTANCASSGNKNGQLNIKGGATMTLDGGTFVNNNDRTKTYGNMIATDGSDGTMRIINGGVFKSPNIHVELGAKQGSTGTLSVDNGTVEVGGATGSKWLTVGGTRGEEVAATYGGTGILAMTNATLIAESVVLGSAYKYANTADGDNKYTAKVTFIKDTKITTQRLYSLNKVKADSFVIFDGATVNTAANSKDLLAALAVDYTLEGSGVTINTKHSGTTVGGAFVGNGPFIKKGAETLTFKGKFTDSADLRVEEGMLAFSGATLPAADKIALTISGTGAFEGLDQSATYKSLTLGEDAVLPVAFENGAATTFKAAETIVTATADHPVTIAGTGTLTANTVVAEGLTVTDASLFVLSAVAGSLKIEDGKLIAVKPSRPVDTLTWAKGSAGDNWSGTDNWTYGDPAAAATFQEGDTALFATAGDKAVVDADVTAAKVEFTADATVTGTGTATLTTTNITVGADVTATIAAPLSEDIEKTGEGKLVLQNYADGKALDLKGGKVSLVWSDGDAAHENPFSTANDANSIAGVLDFGGAKQTLAGNVQNNSGIFRNGGEVRHGEIEVDPSSWLYLNGITDFTVGEGANVYFKKYATNTDGTRNRGQLNMYNAYLRIVGEGARFAVMNERTTQDGTEYNSYGKIGSSGDATVEVGDGGTFAHEKRGLILGWNSGRMGAIVGDGGNVTVGGKELFIGYNGAAMLALTNSTLTAKYVNLGWSKQTPGKQTIEFVGGTTVKVAGFKKNAVHAESSILFDDATLVPTAEGDLLPNLGIPTTIGANGLVISNDDFDVTVAAPLAGEGKLTKTGAGMLTLSDASTFAGGIEVQEGDIAFAKGATLPKGALAVADGTTVTVNYSADGFAGTPNLTLSVPAEGKVHVEIDAAQIPEGGKAYKLFNGIEGGTADNLTITDGYGIEIGEDGSVTVKLSPKTHTWDGEGQDKNWGTAENWSTDKRPVVADSIVFNEGGAETVFDLADGLALANIEVNAGAWTTKVDNACFAGVPVQVEAGALFALTGAKVTNPFSTAKDANSIAGVLDLGGATQNAKSSLAGNGAGIFRDGGVLQNGKLVVDPSDSSSNWWRLKNTTFTVGKGATLEISQAKDQDGEIGFNGGACLIIDGGRVNALNKRETSGTGGYIGCDAAAENVVRIQNGGTFYQPNQFLRVGFNGGATGIVSVDNGTVDLGGQELRIASDTGSTGIFAMTNGTLKAKLVQFSEVKSRPSTFILKDSVVTIGQICKGQTPADGSSVVFDGATIVDNHEYTALLQVLGIPYTIAEGGLTVKVANKDADDDYVSFPGTFNGEGDFILVAAGNTPREAKFTNEGEKGFTGNLVVSNKITVVADGKTFRGGLCACEGSTLDVATSVFDGDVTVEEGVKFTGLDTSAEILTPVTLLQTKGTITSPLLDYKDPVTKNRYFVRSRLGVNMLCYGRKPGTMIILR